MISYTSKGTLELARALDEDDAPLRAILSKHEISVEDVRLTWGSFHKVLTCVAADSQAIGRAMDSLRSVKDLRSDVLLIFPREQYVALLHGMGSQRT